MGVEVKSGGEGVSLTAVVMMVAAVTSREWPTGNQVSYREHC